MGKGILSIYDPEGEYGGRLMDYLNRQSGFPLEACVFTGEECLLKALEEQKTQILLASGALPPRFREHRNVGRFLTLSESAIVKEGEEEAIYKYQPASAVMKRIMALCCEGDLVALTAAGVGVEVMKAYVFASPCGGSGKTMLSQAFAEHLAKEKKVLYVDWELFSSREGQEVGFSDLMFQIHRKPAGLSLAIRTMTVSRSRVDYLGAAGYYRDLLELAGEDVKELLRLLTESGLYEAAVFDAGFLGEAVFALMEAADNVYLTIPEGIAGERKRKALQNMLKQEGREAVFDKCVCVKIAPRLHREIERSALEEQVTEGLAAFAERLEEE